MSNMHSVNVEQAVLACLMTDPRAFDTLSNQVDPAIFVAQRHQIIFETIVGLIQSGLSAEALAVAEAIKRRGEFVLQQSGGEAYLSKLLAEAQFISAASLPEYITLLTDLYLRREATAALTEAQGILREQQTQSAPAAINKIVDRLLSVTKSTSEQNCKVMDINKAMRELYEDLELDEEDAGIKTGFIELDNRLGGLRPGQLVVIAGRPGMGKTTLALNVADHVAMVTGKCCPFFSMEMSSLELTQRLTSARAGIPLAHLRNRTMTAADKHQLSTVAPVIHQSTLQVIDGSAMTLAQITTICNRLRRQRGSLGAVFIDYLGIMGGINRDNEVGSLAAITTSLKAFAKTLGCPIVLLAQLNRGNEARPNRKPVASDLRGSGSIEQDADMVLLVHREEVYKPEESNKGLAQVIIGKNRNGPTGDVLLAFEGVYSRFANCTGAMGYDD